MSKITKIETGKRNKERVNIYIDNEYSFSIGMELVYKFNIKLNEQFDKEKFFEVIKAENLAKCKESALRTIERSYKTEKEIKDKLLLKEFDEDIIDETLNFLKEYGFIDDSKFVKMFVKDHIRNQGRNKIKYLLQQKGVDNNLIDEAFLNLEKEYELERAYILAEKKYLSVSKREDDDFKIKNKIIRYLLGRGYDYSIAKDILSKIYLNYKGE